MRAPALAVEAFLKHCSSLAWPRRRHIIAKDSSGKGNDLSMLSSPSRMDVEISSGGNSMRTGMLTFKNNLALNKRMAGMPEKSFTIEFWARSKKLETDKPDMQVTIWQ